ncbi:hypothetical protein IQ249_00290 [Lusitaniella coriacea LEGE 07157]|uniref:Uncharacterized protein n=1 Tax=Lusitaniella coriacea LEGE 07157 TaxID=945747 RepID=A0A8J7B7G5_9CYAN|nr:hypothetical protein [Lusitaniella coriacea]MBE9114325.1 hypothetical protein [Lusitaniella coriacea LEGE 07157]
MTRPKSNAKLTYRFLLLFLAMGIFGLFSDMEVNLFLKIAGMSISLQAGFALLYFGVYRQKR